MLHLNKIIGQFYALQITIGLLLSNHLVNSDLVVNVKNQGGEVYKEEIVSDITDETIALNFESPGDGSITTLFIDFKNDIQVIRTDVLGEEELANEPVFMSYCFVTKFVKGDFIPPDAMAKLRQKNPWSIRVPERVSESLQNTTLDILLDVSSSDWISPHLKTLCSTSQTYANKLDLVSSYLENGSNNSENYLRAVRPIVSSSTECSAVSTNRAVSSSVPCQCVHPLCIGWFPCALKYCRSKSANPVDTSSGTFKTYRCGIHTCKSCRNFIFTVNNRLSCL